MASLQIKLECLNTVDSTNTYLKKQAFSGAPEGTAVVANTQTAGRGRMGRSFASAPALGIYMSLLLRPDCTADSAQSLTANTAVAVCRAIETVCGLTPDIKWINDIYLNGKKICGILCESAVGENGLDFVVIGVGLNVITRTEDFPPELRETAGSIYSETGKIVERGELISAILAELDKMYSLWKTDKSVYLEEYKKHCSMLGGFVTVMTKDGKLEVFAEDIAPDFGLKVKTAQGTRVLYSGEVSVRV